MADYIDSVDSEKNPLSKEEKNRLYAAAEKLISAARAAYNASLRWAGDGIRPAEKDAETRYDCSFRNMLRTRLLVDLHYLSATGSPWCRVIDNELVRNKPELWAEEKMLLENFGGSAQENLPLAYELLLQRHARLNAVRQTICNMLNSYGTASFLFADNERADREKDTGRERFLAAEKAWDTYLLALSKAYHPLINGKAGEFEAKEQRARAILILFASHEQRLHVLCSFYCSCGTNDCLTNFSALEMTEDEKDEEQERISNSKTYTPEQKQALYQKARGVEKFLRTPLHLRDCSLENAWSDDEFFKHYAAAIEEDMEEFIKQHIQDSYYIEKYGQKQADEDSASCRKKVQQLVSDARAAYDASLKWHAADIANNSLHTELENYKTNFRNYLRNRLMQDLFRSAANNANYWMGYIRQNSVTPSFIPEMSVPDLALAIQSRSFYAEQYPAYQDLTTHSEKPTEYRNYIFKSFYEAEVPPDKRLFYPEEENYEDEAKPAPPAKPVLPPTGKLFLEAEIAWSAYLRAIEEIHCPIYNWYLCGSGTGGWCNMFSESIEDSHELYLLYIISNVADVGDYESPLTDFTASEYVDEEKLKQLEKATTTEEQQ